MLNDCQSHYLTSLNCFLKSFADYFVGKSESRKQPNVLSLDCVYLTPRMMLTIEGRDSEHLSGDAGPVEVGKAWNCGGLQWKGEGRDKKVEARRCYPEMQPRETVGVEKQANNGAFS